jgi:hypothetical protein
MEIISNDDITEFGLYAWMFDWEFGTTTNLRTGSVRAAATVKYLVEPDCENRKLLPMVPNISSIELKLG